MVHVVLPLLSQAWNQLVHIIDPSFIQKKKKKQTQEKLHKSSLVDHFSF